MGSRHLFALIALLCSMAAALSVSSPLFISTSAIPGQTIKGSIVLENSSSGPERARLYLSDYRFSAEEGTQFGLPGIQPRSNAKWLTLGQEVVVVPAKGQLEVPFTIRVPDQVAQPGSYWSVLMVEPLAEDSALVSGTLPTGMTFRQLTRYAVQLLTDVGNEGKANISFKNPSMTRSEAGRPLLAVTLENTGTRYTQPKIYAEVYSQGKVVNRIDAEPVRLYPGTSARQTFELPLTQAGDYQIVVVADGGENQLYGVRYDMNIPK